MVVAGGREAVMGGRERVAFRFLVARAALRGRGVRVGCWGERDGGWLPTL